MSMHVRAKFRVMSMATLWSSHATIELAPVTASDKEPENKVFWQATPDGRLELVEVAPHLDGVFCANECVWVDIFDRPPEPGYLDELRREGPFVCSLWQLERRTEGGCIPWREARAVVPPPGKVDSIDVELRLISGDYDREAPRKYIPHEGNAGLEWDRRASSSVFRMTLSTEHTRAGELLHVGHPYWVVFSPAPAAAFGA